MMKNILFICVGLVMTFSACAKKDYLVTIHTSYGDIKVILYDQTPKHKANFIKLAENGDYDSTTFHRVIKDFMIQGGDVNAKPGNQNKIEYTIPAEFIDTLFHHKGVLAAARKGDQMNPTKASSGSQWYIVQGIVYSEAELTTDMNKVNNFMKQLMQKPDYEYLQEELYNIYTQEGQQAYSNRLVELVPVLETELGESFDKSFPEDRLKMYTTVGGTPHLDDAYTVFGRVVEGLEVVDKIAAVETAGRDVPVENVYMTMEVEKIGTKKLQKLYGSK